MPTIVTGNVRTDQVLAAKVPVYMREKIALLDAERAFFEYLSRQFRGMESIESMKYEFMEMRCFPFTMTCDEVTAAADTEVHVDHPEYAHKDQLIYNTRTGEFYLMNEDIGGGTTAGTITVLNQTAGSGGITIATAVGDILQILPEAHAEGESIPPAFSHTPTNLFTYLFQHDRTRGNTDIQRLSREYGTKQLLLDRKQFWVDEMRGLNMLLYIGEHSREVMSASGPRRHSMRGLKNWITTNKVNYGEAPGLFTLPAVGELMRRTKNHSASSDTKVGICGQNSWEAISAMPASAIRTTVGETEWGKKLKSLVTPYGNLAIGYDNMLEGAYGMDDIFVILDPAHIQRLQLKGAETRLLLNVEANDDIHNQKDEITGTDGLAVGLEELHAWGYGIS
ncbi:MAG: hypothetical protein WC451_05220 [Patescibacteria group bacterium]